MKSQSRKSSVPPFVTRKRAKPGSPPTFEFLSKDIEDVYFYILLLSTNPSRNIKTKNDFHPLTVRPQHPEPDFSFFVCVIDFHCFSETIKNTLVSYNAELGDVKPISEIVKSCSHHPLVSLC